MENEEDEFRKTVKVDYDAKFLEFVEERITELRKQDRLGKEMDMTMEDLERTLRDYQKTFWALLAIHSKTSFDLKKKKERFELWWDGKFIATRMRENRPELTAQKWASMRELESMTRFENTREYVQWREELTYLEENEAFTKRILDQWREQNYTLGHLCGLVQTDFSTTNIGNRLG